MGACSIDGGGCPCERGGDDAPAQEMKTFLCHYMHNGQVHSASIEATSMDDAMSRLRSLSNGVVDCAVEPDHEV